MEAHANEFPVISMAKVLEVSRSGYYNFLKLKKENKSKYPAEILENVYSIWESKGNCWDNAVAESFFSIFKREIESNIYYDIYDTKNSFIFRL